MSQVEQHTQELPVVEDQPIIEKEEVEKAEPEKEVQEAAVEEEKEEETEKEKEEEEDKENQSQALSQTPVAVIPPTKRVLEDDGEQEEECLKKSRPSEESAPLSQEQTA